MALPSGPNFEFHADRPVGMNIDLNELFDSVAEELFDRVAEEVEERTDGIAARA